MASTLRSRKRGDAGESTTKTNDTAVTGLDMDNPSSDIEIYAKEVLNILIADNLPPTPNNFSLYFDRLLESKSEAIHKQIVSMLELEDTNNDENTIALEQNLKKGFASVKNILATTANLYKNMTLMTKLLEKRKMELGVSADSAAVMNTINTLDGDIAKLSSILKNQSVQMKEVYAETANIVKSVENETIFDNHYGVYNKRYLLIKIEQELDLIKKYNHSSSLILLELSSELKESVRNEKAVALMTKTLARMLLKTSRRSDIVAHYGNGIFAMLLKYTDIESAKHASERLCELVSNSNFFFSDQEIQLKISIGVTNVSPLHSVEEIIVSAMTGIEQAYKDTKLDYAVSLRS